ncbi:MAG TPA: TolC family protein, partial [Gemmataceae bacterium]|nr:TolC family protein [Gemmataceae bacterium]
GVVYVEPAEGDNGTLQVAATQIVPPTEKGEGPSSITTLMKNASMPVNKEEEKAEKKWTAAPQLEGNKADENRRPANAPQVYQVDRTLPSPEAGMSIPTIPSSGKVRPFSLAAALAQAGVENPVINIARQAVVSAQGLQLQARVLLLPSVNVGAYYGDHTGPVQASFGAIRKVDRQTLDYGLGTYTDAANTIKIPGLLINTPLTDAIFEPRVARYVVSNRSFLATATRNDIFLEVSTTYLALMNAETRLAIIRQSERDFEEVVRLTASFAKRGAARYADAERAAADLQALRYEEQQAQQDVAVASADLAQLLNLDPSIRLVTGDIPLQVVQFIDPKIPLPKLLEIAEQNHPAILAASANIRAGQIRIRQETARPLMPNLWMGLSAGDFGGGAVATTSGTGVYNPNTGNANLVTNNNATGQTVPLFGKIAGRIDVDVIAYWQLQNMGFGNLAHIRERRAQRNQAEADRLRILNEVREKVSVAYNSSAEHFRDIAIKRRWVQEATDGFQRDLKTAFGIGGVLPIETLDNAKRLREGREALLDAVIGFDRAQFQLFVALGQPPTLVVEDDKPPPPPPPPAELPPPAKM